LKSISSLGGTQELEDICKYAISILTEEEKKFIEKINAIKDDFVNERIEEFIEFYDIIRLKEIWNKYHHLKPFQFSFDPRKNLKTSHVVKKKNAFIIFTVWKFHHYAAYDDFIDYGSLAAAKILARRRKPFSEEVKLKAVQEFLSYHGERLGNVQKIALEFWEKEIFPFLEGKWEFKWEIIQKNKIK
jgi:hypothetical protein